MDKLAAILPNKVLSVMSFCLLFVVTGVMAAANEQIERARQLQLAQHPAWLDLIHLNTGVFGSVVSEIADAGFFLAGEVKPDAQAELEATLRGFNQDSAVACQFPARWYWLQQQLDLGPSPECVELQAWKSKLAAQHLTLLFPSMYLQNPASMFGHTFLRLDQANTSPLLNYTLSYAARPDQQDSVASYIYKGVFGGYPGVFAVQPYYQTVSDYGDIEQRDIWEYALNLNASEIDQLLNHVWELRDKKIDYYFFRENCAYELLTLIDVARPGLNLARQQFAAYTLPVDTVRSLRDAGVMTIGEYRPARANRVLQMYAQLDATIQQQVLVMAEDDNTVLPVSTNATDQARVLELAAEMRQLENTTADTLLSRRSALTQSADWLPITNPDPVNSHASARSSVAYGEQSQRAYTEFGVRPVFHDLLDDDAGLLEGTGLEFLTARLRYYSEQDRLQLQQLSVFNMQNYSPMRPWSTPVSSELVFAMHTIADTKEYFAEGGVGLSAKTAGLHVYMLLDMTVATMPEREQRTAAYVGVHTGIRSEILSGRLLLDAKWQNSVAGFDETRTVFKAGYQWDLSRRYALRMAYELWRSDTIRSGDLQLGVLAYF
jgi:hypothetical protein